MWWSMSEAGGQVADGAPAPQPVRMLAIAGTMQRRQRTVLTLVPLTAVHANPDQPRKHFDAAKLAELASSIKAHGLLQPVVVRRHPEGFELIAGERRYRAASLAGLSHIPALIRDVSDPIELALIENLQREDLTPLEEAEALALLIERHGYSHRQVADMLGKSRPYVSNMLSLTRLPDEVKTDLAQEERPVSRELLMGVARQENPGAAVALWRRLKLDLLSVRQFREEKSGPKSQRETVQEVLASARRLNRSLKRLLAEEVPTADAARLGRALRRTQRLLQRQLGAIQSVTITGA
jgi:ParB family transcriptional regulator, chromosome partitioning protein